MISLDQPIEETIDSELPALSAELKSLSAEELRLLGRVTGILNHEHMTPEEIGTGLTEITWGRYLTGFRVALGKPSVLDPDQADSSQIDLDEIVEEHKGPNLLVVEHEIEQLSQAQLECINVELGAYTSDRVKGADRDSLEISTAEFTWADYFAAYRKIVGDYSELDPERS